MESKNWDMTSGQTPDSGNTGSGTPSGGVIDEARESTGQILEQARSMTDKIVEKAKTEGSRRLSAQIEQASQRVDHVSGAIRSLGGQLRESDQTSPIAGYMEYSRRSVRSRVRVPERQRSGRDRWRDRVLRSRAPHALRGSSVRPGCAGGPLPSEHAGRLDADTSNRLRLWRQWPMGRLIGVRNAS